MYLRKLQLDYKKVLVRWRFTALWTAWSTWFAGINHSQSVRNIGRKALRHIMHTTTAKFFDTWAQNTADKKRVVKLCQRKFLRRYMKQLALALDGWLERVQQIQMLRDTANKVLLRWKLRELASAFVVWHEKAFVAVKFRRACQAFLLRWRNRGLSRAFTTWRLLFSREKHYAAICGASLYLYVLSRRETGGKRGILLTILVADRNCCSLILRAFQNRTGCHPVAGTGCSNVLRCLANGGNGAEEGFEFLQTCHRPHAAWVTGLSFPRMGARCRRSSQTQGYC